MTCYEKSIQSRRTDSDISDSDSYYILLEGFWTEPLQTGDLYPPNRFYDRADNGQTEKNMVW